MIIKFLHWKRAAFSVLFTLLLSVAGVTNVFAQTFTSGNLNYSLNDDGATVTVTGHVDGTAATGELVIPESVELYGTTYPVTVIGESAFQNCYNLTGDLVIPNSVITIGYRAFYYCSGFTGSLTIGNAVQTISGYAFYYCNFTGTLTIPESVTYISYNVFDYCDFTSLNFNATNCSSISGSWLNNCYYLTTLTIGENVQVIPSYFLTGHTSFTGELVIPESVTIIGNNAFDACTGFTGSLTIPNSVISIYQNAFNGCTGFTGSLTIGNSVTTIGENAFNGCTGFTGSLTIPNAVTSISTNAFSGCTGFSGTLSLGNSVTQIGNTAFFGACSDFSSIEIWAETPPILGNNVFLSADYGIPVSVPCGSLDAYQEAEGWNVFTNLQEFNPCLWEIMAETSPAISGTVNGTGIYEQGQTCTLTATPNEGYYFMDWTENGVVVSTDAEYAFMVTGNRSLVARFTDGSSIVIGYGGDTISKYLPSFSLYCFSLTQQIYTAEEIGWLDEIMGNAAINSIAFFNEGFQKTRNYDIYLVHTDKTNFESANDWVAVTEADKVFGGAVTMASDDWTTITFDTPFAYNGISNLALVIDDNSGNWSSNNMTCRVFETNGSQAIRVYSDNSNYDPYNPDQYEGTLESVKNEIVLGISFAVFATASPVEGGSVSGAGAYHFGEVCTLTATPSSDAFVFVNWTENGEVVSSNAQYSFIVTENRNFVANFLHFRFDITAIASPEVCGTVTGAGNYLVGQTCTLTATPNEGYIFYQWLENGEVVSTNPTYSFVVTADRALTARFKTANPIIFADPNVETICVNNWDSDGDGFLSYGEAAAVTDLGSAFRNHSEITSFNELQYFTGLTSIGYRAFYYCYNLSSVTLPSSVTSIDSYAFYYSGLSGAFVVPSTVTSIGTYAFSNCYGLTSVNLSGSISYLNDYVFNNCYNLSSITLPTSLTSIGSSTFQNCSSLSSISLPNAVSYIYSYAFYGCTGLTSVELSSSLYSIGYRAFYGCSNLTGTLNLPNGVNSIGEEAFMDCTALSGLNLSQNLGSIGANAFRNCSGIRGEITLPASLWSVGGYAFYGCDGISTVNYNATNCSSFGSASNPVFYDCAFPHLNIGANVQSIPDYAFKRCFMITDMNVAAVNPPTIYSSTFGMVPRSIPVTVPFGSGNLYRSAQYWEEFFNIIEDNGVVYTNYWQPNGSQYADNMSVIGIIQIDGVEQSSNALEIGAFCGDECRGSQLLTYYPQLDRYLVFFTLYGEEDDVLFFRLYNHELGQESELGCVSYITFESNGILGSYASPYVFNFTHIQNTMLSTGWTWYSSYVELSGINGLSMMEESIGDNGVMIKSQASGYVANNNGQWTGSLNVVNNEQMYTINTSVPCVLSMTGSYADPTQHPISLYSGWTWIGYPLATATEINDALSGLNPIDGDLLKAKNMFSVYMEGTGWIGMLNTLKPGAGLMYYSQNSETVSLVYATEAKGVAPHDEMATEVSHYMPELSSYSNNMNVIAVVELEGTEVRNSKLELAVFAGNECRGNVHPIYLEALDRYIAFLTVAGDESTPLSWKLFDPETGIEYCCDQSVTFETNDIIGSLNDPLVLSFSKMTSAEDYAGFVSVYPNPVKANEMVSVALPFESKARLEMVNVMGAVLSTEIVVGGTLALKVPETPGIYMMKVIFDGKGTYTYKLVVE